jgi:3-oxoacyl-[acyl-carrier protein] reductase
MINRKNGKIINISSIWGEIGGSCEVHYSAAKAGLIGMTKALAKEVGLSGITVNSVSPGVILTDMTSHFDEDTMNELKGETPLNRIGTPEDVAGTVAFLASADADFITGQDLAVNGGMNI